MIKRWPPKEKGKRKERYNPIDSESVQTVNLPSNSCVQQNLG